MKTQKYSWNTGSYPSFSSPLSFNMSFSWWANPFTSPQTLLHGESGIIRQKNQHLWLNDIIRLLAGSSAALVTESLDLGNSGLSLVSQRLSTTCKRQISGRWKVTFNRKGFFFSSKDNVNVFCPARGFREALHCVCVGVECVKVTLAVWRL